MSIIRFRSKQLRLVCAALLAICVLGITPAKAACPDVAADAWYAAAVEEATSRGAMQPDANGLFRPDEPATRAELVDALWRSGSMEMVDDPADFVDLDNSVPHPAVDWAAAYGVVTGDDQHRFRGGDSVTRQEFAAMVWRFCGFSANRRSVNYADTDSISEYAAGAVAWCRENGILNGVGENRFDPNGLVTRAQTAAVITRLMRPGDYELPPLTGCVICVDPGHCVTPLAGKGYRDPVSPLSDETKATYTTGTEGKNLTEEKLNLIVGLKLRDRLRELGATVFMTREVSNITINGVERCELPNRLHVDVAVRIHADGNDDRSVHGVCVMTPTGDLLGTPSIKDESVRLGQLMVDAVAAKTGAKNRGIMPRYDLTGFNFSEVPTVLIEMGFMTNAAEDALLETDEYQNKIVDGMIESLMQWYGLE